jgi:hypothetical protein
MVTNVCCLVNWATRSEVRSWPILLKNPVAADDRKILVPRRREGCGDLGGHQERLRSSRMVSWHV